MILDGHIHMDYIEDVNISDIQEKLLTSLNLAGIYGGLVISPAPSSENSHKPIKRINQVVTLTENHQHLYPFYWIDPTEEDALDQVDMAQEMGIDGFKVICNHFFPGDSRAMKAYEKIALNSKPMLFHSGILWDGTPSSKYNRPIEFECLLEIPNLKFSLAHVSWPWTDECIAVYGKMANSMRSDSVTCE